MEGFAYGVSEDNIGVVKGVESDGLCLFHIDLAFCQDALVDADIDDITHHAAGLGIIALETALESNGKLFDERRVDKLGGLRVEARTGKFVLDDVTRGKSHIVAFRDMVGVRHRDGKGAARENVLCRFVLRGDAHSEFVFLRDSSA